MTVKELREILDMLDPEFDDTEVRVYVDDYRASGNVEAAIAYVRDDGMPETFGPPTKTRPYFFIGN